MALETTLQPRIALLGGGYTLQRVAKLLPHGSFVITSRSEDTCMSWRRAGWLALRVSLSEKESVAELFAKYPTIKTIVDSVPPLRSGDPALGVNTLLSVLSSTQVQRIVYLSTTGVFGVRDGSIVTEETPPRPWNSQGEARWLSEQAYTEYAARIGRLHVTALRLPAIYGFDRGILHSIRAGTYALIDDGMQWTNRIHVDDLATIIVKCIEHGEVLPPVLCVSDDAPTRAHEVASFVCTAEGLPYPKSISAQEAVARGAYTMVSNQQVRNEKMKQVLGIALKYPSFREGLYRKDGKTCD
jgi:dTDP-4-dehydrorhamnose reductase